MTLKFETIVNGPFQENCFLVWDSETLSGAFIDPGSEPERLVRTAKFMNIEIEGIYNTHGHIDHVGAVSAIQQMLDCPFALHPADRFLLETLPSQAQMFGLGEMDVPSLDNELADGDKIVIAGHEALVIHTPGHTPGGVCFLFEGVVVVGDTLFSGSIGRTDLPGGSTDQLISSIKERLLVLDDDVKVFCGHGPATTIGLEREHNPFLGKGFHWGFNE
ncbi:MAG: MBL fold metallo-hydrolase [Myxococcota bacterium]|nr:MBL fold metallo-hydrolase [Myxococcota bacterium]